ncbi:MAG TPA: hypothetical protein VK563_07370 [Puia sp.]|nr:hypothetical protein [Puia sp.]
MRYEYVVILRRDSDRSIDTISILLCLFSALTFLYDLSRSAIFNYYLLFSSFILLVGTGYTIYRGRVNKVRVRYRWLLLIAGAGWVGMPWLQWLSAFFVLFVFLEYQAKYPLEIGFSADRVVINTLIKRRFDWSFFSNVILKDGLLTLDFKNNRLFQKEVMDDEESDADEDEFNDYCRERLAMADRAHSAEPGKNP